MDQLIHRDVPIPCFSRIKEIESIHHTAWLNALMCERMERKTQDIFRLLQQYKDDWNEVFYITLTRNFGFGLNSDAFERLAKSLPLQAIRKQRSSSSHIEAMLFGQAGMLSEPLCNAYDSLLRREYQFLSHKYNLTPLDESLFKKLRLRPNSFPHIKIAQLAAIWVRYDTLFSRILEEEEPAHIKALFRIAPSSFWDSHYHFLYKSSEVQQKYLGENALNTLLINTVVPLLFAYGQKNDLYEYPDRAIRLLESLPAEQNRIVSTFGQAGIKAQHAGDSQALIQLKREYCEQRKCIYCRIGFRLLNKV
jgi:hypothetical protein